MHDIVNKKRTEVIDEEDWIDLNIRLSKEDYKVLYQLAQEVSPNFVGKLSVQQYIVMLCRMTVEAHKNPTLIEQLDDNNN